MDIVKPITLDLLETKAPALSATSDMPVIETKPDSQPDPKPETKVEKPEAKAEEPAAAPEKDAKTDSEADSADDLEQPESTSANEPPKKPARGVQKRLDELTKRAADAEARATAEREEKARLLALLEQKEKPKVQDDSEPAKPLREAFDSDQAYTEALIQHAGEHAAWKVETRIKAEQEADRKKQAEASIAEQSRNVQLAYAARVEKFKEKHSDYSEVAESPDVSVSIPMAHAIAHSEHGPEIAYFLGSNPEEAKRISALSPPVQLMELGLIVAGFKAQPPKPVSAAPAPLKPNKPVGETPRLSPEEESMEQYAARRKKEMAAGARPGVRH